MTEADKTFVAGALKELAQHLKEDTIKLPISVKRLASEPDLVREVNEVLNKPNDQSCGFSYYVAMILGIFSCHVGVGQPFAHMRLLLYCHKDSQVAKAAKNEAARMNKAPPCWGATNSPLAAAYPPKDQLKSKFTIWHETVHLLLRRGDDLDECYEPYPPYHKKDDCNCDTCIMQFEPPKKWVGEWSLCDKIIGFLRDLSKNCRENKQG